MNADEQTRWANAATVDELRRIVVDNNLLVPPKTSKADIVKLLVANGITRKLKRSHDKVVKTGKQESKQCKVNNLISKVKQRLGEPTGLHVTPGLDGCHIYNDRLVMRNNVAVAALKDGILVNMDRSDVEIARGARIDFDILKIIPKPAPEDDDNKNLHDDSDNED